MALFDQDQQRIVVRVVYDGAAYAGKTTNLQQLCSFFTTRRRSELMTPEEANGRTLYFDWLQLEGGIVGGHQLRCQLLTVPGQPELLRRRTYLVRTADVIVFVCDSTRAGIAEGKRMLETLLGSLNALGLSPALVLQANKQDTPGALAPPAVREALGLAADTPLVGARVNEGHGVRETVVLAIRAAASRVQRTLLERGLAGLSGSPEGPEQVLDTMHRVEAAAAEAASSRPAAPDAARGGAREGEAGAFGAEAGEADADEPTLQCAIEVPPTQPPAPTSRSWLPLVAAADADGGREPPAPDPEAPSGFIWPVRGRETLKRVVTALEHGGVLRRHDLANQPDRADRGWPSDAMLYEVGADRSDAGLWCLKTSRRRHFRDTDEGRAALLHLARRKALLGGLLPQSTALALSVASDGTSWLWTVAPWRVTQQAGMESAARSADEETLGEVLASFALAAVEAMALAARHGVVLEVSPSNFSGGGEELTYLDDEVGVGEKLPAIARALLRRVDEYGGFRRAIEAYLLGLERGLRDGLTPEEVRRIELVQALEAAQTHGGAADGARRRLLETARRIAA